MNERDLWSWKTAKSNTWLAGQCIMYHKAVIGFGTSLRSQAPDSGSRRRRDHQQERSLAEEGSGESLRLFYGADVLGDAHIHLNATRAEAKAETHVHLGDGMSAGSPVKNVEASSPATTRQARSNAPQRLATAVTDTKARLNLYLSGYGVLHAVKNRETPGNQQDWHRLWRFHAPHYQ